MTVKFYRSGASMRACEGALRRGLEKLNDPEQLVADLEGEIRARTDARHAITCNSGTDALIALLFAVGVGPGDEVIVPAYSFFASASCIVHVGATPVFVDIDRRSYAATVETIWKAITKRTKAVLVVHLFHTMAQIKDIAALCIDNGLTLVEDSAEAISMRRDGVHAGLFGSGGVLSFFPTKTWGGVGDAGAVITNNDEIARDVRLTLAGRGEHPWTSNIDALQAAVLLARVSVLDEEVHKRESLAQRYAERLGNIPGLLLPTQGDGKAKDQSVWYVYLIETSRRDELLSALSAAGIGTDIYYPRVIPDQPCFRRLRTRELPIARAAATRAVGLPLYPDMSIPDVDVVCDAILAFEGQDHQ